jgi:hypothetical protein
VSFTLEGTAGGTAKVSIGSLTIPLRETSSGQYTGKWMPSATDFKGGYLANTVVMGFLSKNGGERQVQAAGNLSFDLEKPRVRASAPVANSKVGPKPRIEAIFTDNSGGIDPASVSFTLNGQVLTDFATIATGSLMFEPTNSLAPGVYTIKISAKDQAGNLATGTWSFTVIAAKAGISSVSHNAGRDLQPGQTIVFTLNAEPKGKAYFAIGSKFRRGSREISLGTYVGEYTIRTDDRLDGETVTAVFTAADGKVYSQAAPTPLGNAERAAENQSPKISSPTANQVVVSPLVVRGTAVPGSKVAIKISYETTLIGGGLKKKGSFAEIIVSADSRGNFSTSPTSIDIPIRGRDTVYTVAVTSVLAGDKRGEPVVVNVRGG